MLDILIFNTFNWFVSMFTYHALSVISIAFISTINPSNLKRINNEVNRMKKYMTLLIHNKVKVRVKENEGIGK